MTLAAQTPAMLMRRICSQSEPGTATERNPAPDAEERLDSIDAAPHDNADSATARAYAPGDDMAALTLDEHGMILDCSRAAEALFKYRRSGLVWRHVSVLLPQLAELDLMPNGQPNARLRFLCRIGRHLQAVTHDGKRFASDLFLSVLDNAGYRRLLLIVRRAGDHAYQRPAWDGSQTGTEQFIDERDASHPVVRNVEEATV